MKEIIEIKELSSEEMLEFNGGSPLTYKICYFLGRMWAAYEDSMRYNQISCGSAV